MIYRLLLNLYGVLPARVQEVAEWLLSTKTTAGVCVAAFDTDGRVLLFRHRYHPSGSWRLPGGHADRGELPEHALARELAEEGGALVQLDELVHVEVSERWPARMTMYYAGSLTQLPQRSTAEVTAWQLSRVDALPPGTPLHHRIAIERGAANRRHRKPDGNPTGV